MTAPSDATSSPYALPALRRHYQQAAADEAASRHFHALMSRASERDAVQLAYKAAAEALLAKHTGGVFDKLERVKAASRQFDAAVALSPQHPEVRFLRFSVESNLPRFLGASKHVDDDRAFLVQAALQHPRSGLDAEAFELVRRFLLDHQHLTPAQARQLGEK
ncbi:hypothetical protein [Hymenobacter sp. B81]|uniref:hypothetical protein n=1 Tax=Hymenobacter sp. B81 TaxID=3344878 RepID=UPI0037DD0177